jgi:hypothetical protein
MSHSNEGAYKMKRKIVVVFSCMILLGILVPLSSATTTGSSQQTTPRIEWMKKTVFIGRFTVLSHNVPLNDKHIVGWVFGNGELFRYRSPLPEVIGTIIGVYTTPFVMLVFDTNPFH